MKKLLFGTLILVVLLVSAACSSRSSPNVITPAATYANSAYYQDIAHNPLKTVAPTTAPAPVLSIDSSKGGGSSGTSYYSSAESQTIARMVIRSATLTLVVDDISLTMTQITNLAASSGGFVVSSNLQEDQNRLYAYITFRVDAKQFSSVLNSLKALAVDVKAESTGGEDVTDQYVDLTSRLKNLEASETQLLELMTKAGTVDDILAVQKELTNTRGQIEQIKGQMQYLEQSTSLALFSVSLEQSKLAVEFTADTRSVKEGQSIQFMASISGGFAPYSYEWNFGDGKTSNEANAVHAYGKGGTFTVSLKVTDDKGSSQETARADYIVVKAGWSAGGIAHGAWSGLVGFGRFLLSFIIGLGVFSPVWIVILVILYFTVWRRRKKNQK